MNRDLSNRIKNAVSSQELGNVEAQIERTIFLAGKQLREVPRKKRIGFWEMLLRQARFIGIRAWAAEAAAALFLVWLLHGLLMRSYLFTPRKIAFCLSCMMVTASMLALPFFYRSSYFRMLEVESAAYFSIRRILFARFLLFFVGEALIAAGIYGAACVWQSADRITLIYVLLPLLLMCDGILFFLKYVSPEKFCVHYACYGAGMLLLLFGGYRMAPWVFDGGCLHLGLGAGMLLLCCLIYQCASLVKYEVFYMQV